MEMRNSGYVRKTLKLGGRTKLKFLISANGQIIERSRSFLSEMVIQSNGLDHFLVKQSNGRIHFFSWTVQRSNGWDNSYCNVNS